MKDELADAKAWQRLIENAAVLRPPPIPVVAALGFVNRGASRPVRVVASGRRVYVAKVMRPWDEAGRRLFADQVVGRLASFLGAPVPQVELLKLSARQREEGLYFRHVVSDLALGSAYVEGCEDSREVAYWDVPENVERFARLAVLYGWTGARDRQYLYEAPPSRVVHSVDHGDFLGGPGWTVRSLRGALSADGDPFVMVGAKLSRRQCLAAVEAVGQVTPQLIATAVAIPPDECGISMEERVEVAQYLHDRQGQLLAAMRSQG